MTIHKSTTTEVVLLKKSGRNEVFQDRRKSVIRATIESINK